MRARRLFVVDVAVSLAGDSVTLFLGDQRVHGAARAYRAVVRGEVSGSTEAEVLLQRLREAGFLRGEGPEQAAEGAFVGPQGRIPAELGALRPFCMLGRGSFGAVYAAFDAERGIDCAVKICEQVDHAAILDLKNEARTTWSLTHPNLVAPYELRCELGLWFFAMELVPGRRIVDAFATVPENERLSWLARVFGQIADALDFVHARGVLHLDLTPNNLLVREDGTPSILDLGLARWGGARPLGTLGVAVGAVGTLSYIAPEMLLGREPTAASDWYSLGIVLFRLLAGFMPFHEMGAMEITLRPLASPPRSLRGIAWVPAALAEVCEKLLERRPERRADGAALRAALGVEGVAPQAAAGAASEASRAHSVDAPVFFGREALLGALAAQQQSVAAQGPVLVRIGGQPGIGKTALISRFAEVTDALVLAGRCYEHEYLPYKGMDGVIDALRGWLIDEADPALRARVQRHMGGLARSFPGLRDLAEGAETVEVGADSRIRVYQALKAILREIAAVRPLVLILDDVHWADRDSARLLAELLSPPAAPQIMVVCAHRMAGAVGEGPFLGELAEIERRGASYRRAELAVGPLDEGSLVEIAIHYGARVDTGAVARAVADAAGSPFLVEEVARFLTGHDGATEVALRDAVAARLEALLPAEREVVELTAVAGRSLDERLVAAASSAEGEVVSRGLVILRAQSLLRGSSVEGRPTVAIYHDRLRTEVVGLLSSEQRAALHRRWIGALESVDAPPHELFVHYRAVGDERRAAALALAAAVQAEAALAFAQAAEWYREALTGVDEVPRAELLRRRADALFNAGRTSAAGDAFVAAADADEGDGRAHLRRAADAYLMAGRFEDGRRLLAPLLRAHDVPVASGTARLVGSLIRQLISLELRGIHRRPVAGSAADAEVIDACWSLGKALIFVEPLVSADFVLRSLRRSIRAGDPRRIARALSFLAGGVFFQVPLLRRRAQGYLDDARALVARLDEPVQAAVIEVWSGMIELGMGRWRVALARIEAARVALGGHPGADWERVTAGGLVVWLLVHVGDVRRAFDLAAGMLAEASERGDLYGQVNFTQYVAWYQVLSGHTAEARRQARWIEEVWSPGAYTVQSFYVMMIEVLCGLYEGDVAGAAARWQAGQAGFRAAGGERAPQSRIDNALLEARVLLRGPRSARALGRISAIRSALAREERSDAQAHAGWLTAALRARAGDPAGAAIELAAAGAKYAELGLRHWASAALLQVHRLDPRGPAPTAALEDFTAQGVADAARWVETFMPCAEPPASSRGP